MLTTERILKAEIYIKLLDTISKMDHVAPKEFFINSKRFRAFCCSIEHSSFILDPDIFRGLSGISCTNIRKISNSGQEIGS